jgi:hypothetical protein
MHAGFVVSQSDLVVSQTSALVMQISPAALHAEIGVVPVGLAVLQTGLAVSAERSAEAPPGIVVMHDGSGKTSDGIEMVRRAAGTARSTITDP